MRPEKLLAGGLMIAVLAFVVGCNSKPTTEKGPDTTSASTHGHSHDGYWCDEHGLPEAICALCNPKVADELKAKGDWCAKHDLPDSQCFTCHPELKQKFADDYEAKFGEKPPKSES